MTSSAFNGERRGASARRSGMSVLGKVSVPKPINLPSQRLENHGLDPNVEIVPKGTLSWGSKSSSSTSNPWGSLSQSPHTDGGTSSPSHLNGPPSSGGSGTRPSTAGSDRAHESTATPWGSNSRPSSASGAITSNQTSLASLRPGSAEKRPSSSHLSRFAEASSEHSVAWSSAATAEKLGVVHHKDEGFALTSGDFPMLGSEKGNSGKNAESPDHKSTNRPDSSSGGVALIKERTGTSETDDVSQNENVKSATVNSWRKDNPPYGEDGARYGTEKWQGHSQPYAVANMIPPPYDSWNCIPANNPQSGVWYNRGPSLGGPPYGTPAPPGSFPMEPFPYYHPHISASPLANHQPVCPPGVGPRGQHPHTGDVYRHPIPDAFVRPAMPIRPGFFPGPVPYEGYYGPPLGYVNERDAPFPGMVGGPSVYNRYPNQNAPDSNSQGRFSGYGSTGISLVSEKGDYSHSGDTERPFKVLPNQHDCWDDEIVEQNGGSSSINHPLPTMVDQPSIRSHLHPEMVGKLRNESQENWGSDHGKDGKPDSRRRPLAEEASFHTSDLQGSRSSHPIKPTSHENVGNLKAVGDFTLEKLDQEAVGFSEFPQFLPAAPKNFSLIQKIEGLNAKARASDGRNDGTSISNKQEEGNGFQEKSVKTIHSAHEDCGPVYSERHLVDGVVNPVPNEISTSSTEKGNKRGAVSISRRSTHEVQNRGSLRERNKFNQDVHGLQKRSPIDPRGMLVATHPETSNAHLEHLGAVDEADSFPLERHEGESAQPVFDSNDSHVQRAKMRELAKHRTKQLLEEEEERTRKQKAKAWAKLEELNRRTQAESEAEPTHGVDNTSSDAIKDEQEESITFGAIGLTGNISGKYSAVVSNPSTIAHKIEEDTTNDMDRTILCTETVNGGYEELVEHNHFVSLKQDVNVSNAAHSDAVTQVHDDLRHKRMGYRHEQSIPSEKSSMEKLITDEHEARIIPTQAADIKASLGEPSLPVDVKSVVEASTNPRKKNFRSGKSKNKLEEGSLSAIPSSLSKATKQANTCGKPITEYQTVSTSVQSLTISEDANHSCDQLALPIEDSQGKGNGQGKSQHSHRAPRNLQGRSSERFHTNDAVIWAPVRPLNKPEVTDEANQKTEVQAISSFPKADQMQNNSKNKRAEMERYVPKPVAKEMAQQGSIQQPEVCYTNQTTSDENRAHTNSSENVRSTGSTTGIVGSASESRIGDGRHYKQIKSQRLWQQRGDAELTNGQGLQDHFAPKPVEEGLQSQKASESYNDEWNPPDGWNIPSPDSFVPVSSRIARDQGNTGRGKQHQHKGQRGFRNNFDLDQKKLNSVNDEKNYTQSLANEVGQRDFTTARESRGFGERSVPHWQPKSQTFPPNNPRGNRSNDIQNIKKEPVEDTSSFQKDQCISEKGILNGPHHQESKTEKKISTNRGLPRSPNQSSVDISSVFHKGESHSSRPAKGADTLRDLNSAGHDSKQHNPSAYRERPKNSSQYEYQPVGPHNSNKSNYSDGAKDNAGSRYRERARNNSRQGGGNSRQVHTGVDTSYD